MPRYVFIDSRIGNIGSIVAGLAPDVISVVLDPSQDGVDQIANVLAGQVEVEAVHLISHGADGTLYLGNTVLNRESLSRYSSQLATIGAALTTDGDLLLYGCDVAATEYGLQFIGALAHYTGADVAASTDATGSAALGGNLQLEAATGHIEAGSVLTTDAVDTWDQLLAVPVISAVATSAAYTEQAAPIVLAPGLVVTDADGTLVGATVRLNGFQPGDLLAATTAGTVIVANYNAANGVLVFTGNDSVANYQQVLRSVTYSSSSDNPTNHGLNATRSVDWQVRDDTLQAGPLFGAPTTVVAGSNPLSIVMSDLNGDGKLDLAVTSYFSNTIKVALGNGDGTFTAPTSVLVGSEPNSVAAADVNRDGMLDLVVANLLSDNVSVLLGDGNGTFAPAVNFLAGTRPASVTTGDFNGDGYPDLAIANDVNGVFGPNVNLLLGNGNGTFAPATQFMAERFPWSIATADIDSDGKLDLAVANYDSDSVSVLLGNGNGTFAAAASFAAGANPISVAIADVNGDGKLDLALANATGVGNVSVLLGIGNGTFAAATNFAVGTDPESVAIADVNGDGKPDIMAANSHSNNISLLLGNGDGTFAVATNFAVGTMPIAVAIADVNGDGKLDLAVTNALANGVSILLNASTSLSNTQRTLLTVAPVNDASPTFTAMAAAVATTVVNTPATITLSDLRTQGNEADVDGSVDAFMVKTVSSGSLLIGTNAAAAAPWTAGSNDTIDATRQAYWTGPAGTLGTLNAFTVVARDNGGLESALPAVQATVAVKHMIYNWSALTNGQTIAGFSPVNDILHFDDTSISAADVYVYGDNGATTYLYVSYGGKTVAINVNAFSATSTNVTFANGSLGLVGDNTTGIAGDDGPNTLVGGVGNDQIIGAGGADSLSGGDGNDFFLITGNYAANIYGNDTINGGNGSDVIDYRDSSTGATVNLNTGIATGGDGTPGSTLTLSSIERVIGTGFNDVITGNPFDNWFNGRQGNDTIDGGAGFDVMSYVTATAGITASLVTRTSSGVDGVDTLTNIEGLEGSNFGDSLTGANGVNNRLSGMSGNDSFIGTTGADTVDGGQGFDSLFFSSTGVAYGGTTGISVNLATHVADYNTSSAAAGETYTLVSIEFVQGTAGNDVFVGGDPGHDVDASNNNTTEVFRPLGGNDTITGLGGNGNSVIVDYVSNTTLQAVNVNLRTGIALDGQGGNDSLINVNNVRGGAGGDMLTGGSLARSIQGTFFEIFRGNAGNDTINGANAFSDGVDASADRVDYSNNSAAQSINVNLDTGVALDGLGGTDTLIDIDQVIGGFGNDSLTGSAANEVFDGGTGNDTLNGGSGSDEARFQQSTAGVIVNMSAGSILVNGVTVAANSANDGMGGTDALIGIENVRGSDFSDYIRGSDDLTLRQYLGGDAGNDTIDGGAGTEDFASYASVAIALGGVNAFIENGAGTVNDKTGGVDTLINIEGLRGSNSNDTLTGGQGDQWFRGGGGNDIINGGAGNDWVTYLGDPSGVTINLATGNATDGWNGLAGQLALGGTDTLISIENAEGSNYSDTITGTSDNNELRGQGGLDKALYSGMATAYTITRNGLTTTVSGPDGTDTLTGIELLQFLGGGVRTLAHAQTDLSDDGRSDILWRNLSTGQNIAWNSADSAQSLAVAPIADLNWKIAGLGDFDGNGKSDILWRNAVSGQNIAWKGGDASQGLAISAVSDLTWKIAGIGDFNSDGKDDLLWRNSSSGANIIWRSGDSAQIQAVSAVSDPSWKIAGIGDFDGNGTSDILWRNSGSGVNTIWRGGDSAQTQAVTEVPDLSWKIAGIGDFNGDGKDDILWRNSSSGVNIIWRGSDAAQVQAVAQVADQAWKIAGTGDYNGDGIDDLLWRNSVTGADIIWRGGDAAQSQAVASVTDLNWSIIAQTNTSAETRKASTDFDGDGKSDILWRNASSGQNVIWKGADSAQGQAVSQVADTTWKIAGIGDFDGDGKSDILWRNDGSGINIIWKSADSAQVQSVTQVADTTWKIGGIGDFDGDGKSDLLWRNAGSGQNVIWKSADSAQGQAVSQVSDTTWKIAGIGDFDGDGKSDMLWRNDGSGVNIIWKSADSTQVQSVTQVADTTWKVAGIGDFNGDGKSDVLWRNSVSGQNVIWRGADAAQGQAVSQVADTTWKVVGTGDYNGDGKDDILWRNSVSGADTIWNGGDSAQVQAVTTVGDTNWEITVQTNTWIT